MVINTARLETGFFIKNCIYSFIGLIRLQQIDVLIIKHGGKPAFSAKAKT
jgi:hypothetical protein